MSLWRHFLAHLVSVYLSVTSRHLQVDYQELRTASEPYAR